MARNGSVLHLAGVRLLVIGTLVLLLLAPVGMILRLVGERAKRSISVEEEIASSWGRPQRLFGPLLILPYLQAVTPRAPAPGEDPSAAPPEPKRAFLYLTPERFSLEGLLEPEERRRGLFAVNVYRLRATVEAHFSTQELAELGGNGLPILWHQARLVIGIADVRGLEEQPRLVWGDREIPFAPGSGGSQLAGPGAQARLPGLDLSSLETPMRFDLLLRGTRDLEITPIGGQSSVTLSSPWPSPKFLAGHLPSERTVSADGFRASWQVPAISTGIPRAWRSGVEPPVGAHGGAESLGVELHRPAGGYQQVERSVKHAVLFIVLTFATLFLLDVTSPLPLHPIQYLLVGAALCVFYLLLLALSEHLGFPLAYLVASLAVTVQVSLYGRAMLHHAVYQWALPATLATLYGYLFIVLRAEDWALLLGAVGTFVVLALLMALTRRLDWYSLGTRSRSSGPGG